MMLNTLGLVFFGAGFGCGCLTAIIILYVLGLRRHKKAKQELKNFEAKFKNEVEKVEQEARTTLKKLHEIFDRQQEISDELQKPSANAGHSNYKNGLLHEYKELEIDKIRIMETILKDGFDFNVKVRKDDGKVETMKLSEMLQQTKDINKEANDLYKDYDEKNSVQERIKRLAKDIEAAAKTHGTKVHKDNIRQHGQFFVIDGDKDLDEKIKGWDDDDNDNGGNA
ncbi:MAG: hypothetical protein HWN81_00150 [Candidatus Lokiarchaeota archaeon]|nr:hypothetical protein [Candidatus Lokiarchaeota archaeon]